MLLLLGETIAVAGPMDRNGQVHHAVMMIYRYLYIVSWTTPYCIYQHQETTREQNLYSFDVGSVLGTIRLDGLLGIHQWSLCQQYVGLGSHQLDLVPHSSDTLVQETPYRHGHPRAKP